MVKTEKKTLGVWIDKSFHDELKAQAQKQGVSLSVLVCNLLTQRESSTTKKSFVHTPFKLNVMEQESDLRKKPLLIRLTYSEYEALNRLCDFYKKSKQTLIIETLRSFMTSASVLTSSEEEALIRGNFELNKIGVNLNQIARQLNILAKEPTSGTCSLASVSNELRRLEAKISQQTENTKNFLILCRSRATIRL